MYINYVWRKNNDTNICFTWKISNDYVHKYIFDTSFVNIITTSIRSDIGSVNKTVKEY